MLFVRPAGPKDFDALMELAILSGPGFTSLPEHEPTLRERLDVSEASFSGKLAPLECWYTLMLEDSETSEVVGIAGVKAAVGLKRPFFSFRIVTFAQSSPTMNIRFDHRAIVLVNECAGWSEVGSLFLKPERRRGGAGQLLSQSRYLLMAADPSRIADHVLSELRGWFDEDGSCPFWDHVASKFFHMPFADADRMSASTDGQFILDLAPRHPIYLELLPEPAREVISRVHREGEGAKALLEREGFRANGLIDIFDAGPTMICPRDDIRTVRESLRLTVQFEEHVSTGPALVAIDDFQRFRSVRTAAAVDGDNVLIGQDAGDVLGVKAGDRVRVRI
jgi:arginine N-succinyltransferase